jgi:hypothetical protein
MIDIENLEKNAIMKLVTKFHGKAKKSNKENLSEIVNVNTIIGENIGFTFDSEQGENKVFYHEDSLCMLIQEPDGSIKEVGIYEL